MENGQQQGPFPIPYYIPELSHVIWILLAVLLGCACWGCTCQQGLCHLAPGGHVMRMKGPTPLGFHLLLHTVCLDTDAG